ncbi:hypothetical protein C6383_24730, partial [Pseudomonas syringae pv. actinidiae]
RASSQSWRQFYPSRLFVQNLESSITTFMALRNAQPTRYVWNAKGEEILNKIQRAREALEAVQEK